jgi:hypothetical protein
MRPFQASPKSLNTADFVEKLAGLATAASVGGIFEAFELRLLRRGGGRAAIVGGLCRHCEYRRSQSGEPAQVLRRRGEEKFILGSARAAQPQAPKPQDALEMGE